MKKYLLSIGVMLLGYTSFSQYYYNQISNGGNPGGLVTGQEEDVYNTARYPGWTVIHGPSQTTPVWSANQTLPFTFDFNGSPFTQFKISSTGVVTFDVAATAVPPAASAALPNANIPDNSICILGFQNSGSNDNIVTNTFGTAPNRQFWISFTSQTNVAQGSFSYWSVVLEETTNNIYFVDQYHGLQFNNYSVGIQVDASTAYSVAGSPNVTVMAGGNTEADNVYYEFIPGTRPAFDMASTGNDVASIVNKNSAVNIEGTVVNFGSTAVTSYDINYSVNNGTPVTGNISGVNVSTGSSDNFTHPTAWTPTTAGVYTVKTWASNINGNPDANNVNDTLTFVVSVADSTVTRHTLMEVFTSSTCGPCAPGNDHMDNTILPTISNYTVIKYQQNFPGNGDPYFTTESVNRRNFYGINSIPRMEIDGTWDQNAASLTTAIFNSFQSIPSVVKIDITQASAAGTAVDIAGTIKLYADLPAATRYHVVVNEKRTDRNTASNGETEFFHVMMDMIPDENGNSLSGLTSQSTTNFTASTNVAGSNVEEAFDLEAVVFVQDMSTGEIFQSAKMDIQWAVSVDDIANDVSFNVYPNPNQGQFTVDVNNKSGENHTIRIYNVLGKMVYESNDIQASSDKIQLNLNDLNAGVYIVEVKAGNSKVTKRLIIE